MISKKNTLKTKLCVALALWSLLMVPATSAQEAVELSPVTEQAPRIQMAILLDTSGSMSGLINQARTQLWKIVNEFAVMKQNGLAPLLEVALFEYGNDGLEATEGYLRMILPLTDDLDKVSAELFALTTNGGSEYCGWVIQEAVEDLNWSVDPDDLKTIFIAGNEPFTQGGVDFNVSCRAAIAKGVTVNTIFCGDNTEGVNTHWKAGALLADGSYMSIDHNRVIPQIASPQDQEIEQLSAQLNQTYIPYGAEGEEGLAIQAEQDLNAIKSGSGVTAQRAAAKSSGQYRNVRWDLVDAITSDAVKLEEVEEESLPEAMQGMDMDQRKAYVAEQIESRKKIQKKIRDLSDAREKYVAEKLKEQADADTSTFDQAVIECVNELAQKQNFESEKP